MATKTKNYVVDLTSAEDVRLSVGDKFTGLFTEINTNADIDNEGYTDLVTTETLDAAGNLTIHLAYNYWAGDHITPVAAKTKDIIIDGWETNGTQKSTIKEFITHDINADSTVTASIAEAAAFAAAGSAKVSGKNVTGTKFGDTIDATAIGAAGYKINANDGNDIIRGSKGDDKITGGKGTNTIQLNATSVLPANLMGSDEITLTKGEKLILKIDQNTANPEAYVDFSTDAKTGKDLIIDVYDSAVPGNHVPAHHTGTLTIKGYYGNNKLGDEGSIILADTDSSHAYVIQNNAAGTAALGYIPTGTYSKPVDMAAPAFATSHTFKGTFADETITTTGADEKITGGAGVNHINIAGTADFGHDVYTLTKGETLEIQFTDIIPGNIAGDVEYAMNGKDLVVSAFTNGQPHTAANLKGTFTVKNFGSKDITSGVSILDSTGGVYVADLRLANITTNLAADVKTFNGTWVDDIVTSAAVAGSKVNINAGEGDNTIVGGASDDTIKAGAGSDVLFASTGDDKITLGKGANVYHAQTGMTTGTDTITLTSGEMLDIDLSAIAAVPGVHAGFGGVANGDVKLDISNGKDLIISSVGGNFKTIKVANFLTNKSGSDLTLKTTTNNYLLGEVSLNDIPGLGGLVGETYTVKGTTVKGSKVADKIDLSTLGELDKKGYTINAAEGDDTITGSKGNDTIAGGADANVVKLSTASKFGDDVYTLTKGEDLVLQLDTNAAPATLVEYGLEGKDLVVKVYNNAVHNPANYMGSVTIKGYASSDKLGTTGTLALQSLDGATLNVDLKNYQYALAADKATVTGGWLNESLDASAYVPVNHKGVTFNAGAGDDAFTGSSGDDKFTGGAGENTFIYNAGNGGEDTITLTKGEELSLIHI